MGGKGMQSFTCLMSFFQLVRMTVFLSISSFSMNELPRWCSSICGVKDAL